MVVNPREIGKWGEKTALAYLENKGYTVIKQGFRSRFGEIDLIVKNKEFLVFVEVKTRKNANFAHAKEYVSKVKQRKIIATANYWLAKRPTNLQPRFDVVEVYAKDGEYTAESEVVHLENAFGV